MTERKFVINGSYFRTQVREAVAIYAAPFMWIFAALARARKATARRVFEIMHPDEEGWSEWIHPTPTPVYLMKCCDCGLIHEMEFEIAPHGDKRRALNPGEGKRRGVIIFRARRQPLRDRDGAEGGAANAAPVPQDRQARAEGIAP